MLVSRGIIFLTSEHNILSVIVKSVSQHLHVYYVRRLVNKKGQVCNMYLHTHVYMQLYKPDAHTLVYAHTHAHTHKHKKHTHMVHTCTHNPSGLNGPRLDKVGRGLRGGARTIWQRVERLAPLFVVLVGTRKMGVGRNRTSSLSVVGTQTYAAALAAAAAAGERQHSWTRLLKGEVWMSKSLETRVFFWVQSVFQFVRRSGSLGSVCLPVCSKVRFPGFYLSCSLCKGQVWVSGAHESRVPWVQSFFQAAQTSGLSERGAWNKGSLNSICLWCGGWFGCLPFN